MYRHFQINNITVCCSEKNNKNWRGLETQSYIISVLFRYHRWMLDPKLLYLTGSEPLNMTEEYAMQKSWLEDENSWDKKNIWKTVFSSNKQLFHSSPLWFSECTFIVLDHREFLTIGHEARKIHYWNVHDHITKFSWNFILVIFIHELVRIIAWKLWKHRQIVNSRTINRSNLPQASFELRCWDNFPALLGI